MMHIAASAPATRVVRPSVLYFGTPVILLSTLNCDGSTNITPMSSAWALGDRIVLGLGSASQGANNIHHRRECVINVASAALWERVERLARATGRADVPAHKERMGYVHAADKFSLGGLTASPSETVTASRVAECPLQIEASWVSEQGDWNGSPDEMIIFETRVSRVHAHEDILVPGSDHVDIARWHPLLYVFRHYVAAGANLGRNFRAEQPSIAV